MALSSVTSESLSVTGGTLPSDVLFDKTSYNRRNVKLLYEGMYVWILEEQSEGCWQVTPRKHAHPRPLSEQEYAELVAERFTDADLSYSFAIPIGANNPNREPPTHGGVVS